jgi:oligosaccharide translocation protein RFT1
MAVNGVTESFVSSVATSSDLARQSRAMVFCSIAFLGTAWTLLKMVEMGGEGLVWANCVNMGVRILWSCNYIRTWYSSKGVIVDWGLAFPARRTAVAAVVIGLVIRLVSGKADFVGFIPSVTLGGIGGLTLVGCMYLPQTSILIAGHILKENFFDLYMAWLHLGRKRNSGTENDAEMHMMDKLFN